MVLVERAQAGFLYPLDLLRFLIRLSGTGPHGCYLSGMNSGVPGLQPDAGGYAARDGAGAIGVKKLRLAEGAPDGAAVVAPGGNAQRGQPLAVTGSQPLYFEIRSGGTPQNPAQYISF